MAKVPKPGKHASKLNALTRQAAQMLLLKPTMWRLLRVHVHGKANLEGLERRAWSSRTTPPTWTPP